VGADELEELPGTGEVGAGLLEVAQAEVGLAAIGEGEGKEGRVAEPAREPDRLVEGAERLEIPALHDEHVADAPLPALGNGTTAKHPLRPADADLGADRASPPGFTLPHEAEDGANIRTTCTRLAQ